VIRIPTSACLALALLAASCASGGEPPASELPGVEGPVTPGGGATLRHRGLVFESPNLPTKESITGPYMFEFDTWVAVGQVDITMLDGEGRVVAPGLDCAIDRVSVIVPGGEGPSREFEGTRAMLRLGTVSGKFRILIDARSDRDAVRFAMTFKPVVK
jgi:hypothetical protein